MFLIFASSVSLGEVIRRGGYQVGWRKVGGRRAEGQTTGNPRENPCFKNVVLRSINYSLSVWMLIQGKMLLFTYCSCFRCLWLQQCYKYRRIPSISTEPIMILNRDFSFTRNHYFQLFKYLTISASMGWLKRRRSLKLRSRIKILRCSRSLNYDENRVELIRLLDSLASGAMRWMHYKYSQNAFRYF